MTPELVGDELPTVESVAERMRGLAPSIGEERDALTISPRRLHLARNASDQIELFIEGAIESFGQAALGRGLEHGRFQDVNSGRAFEALVIRGGRGSVWARPMAHLAYEALLPIKINPSITNEELVDALRPYLSLALKEEVLSPELQLGLTGELIFLHQLLVEAQTRGIPSIAAVKRWMGWDSASRDFMGGGVAVEVKTTGGDARHHWVHPIYQLLADPGSGERVFVLSIGLRFDRSRAYKLTTAIDRVLECVSGESEETFWEQLQQYGGVGFQRNQWSRYELETGYLATHSPTLYRVDSLRDILRPESFAGGLPPERVLDLKYRVNLEGLPSVTLVDRYELIRELLEPSV